MDRSPSRTDAMDISDIALSLEIFPFALGNLNCFISVHIYVVLNTFFSINETGIISSLSF